MSDFNPDAEPGVTSKGTPADSSTQKSTRSWADLGPRVLSAVVLLSVTIFAVWINGPLFAGLVGLVFAGIYREWEVMTSAQPVGRTGVILIGLIALLPLATMVGGPWSGLLLGVVGLLVAFIGDRGLLMWRLVGIILVSLAAIALVVIRGDGSPGFAACFFLGATVWMTDTGAFFAGRQFGGAKLNPEISPAKTWSGAIGGLIVGALSGLLVWVINVPDSPWWIGLSIAGATSIAGQFGDLAESWVKRHFRIKDSSDLIPGHGGLMDRLDSLTFAALFIFIVGVMNKGTDFAPLGLIHW